jgi:hypothetical protein
MRQEEAHCTPTAAPATTGCSNRVNFGESRVHQRWTIDATDMADRQCD